MIRRVFHLSRKPHPITRTCDDRSFWLSGVRGIGCYCKEATR